MTVLKEGTLEFDFSGAVQAYKFDDPRTHGADAMHKVDFVVEWEHAVWLLEVKDPAANPDPAVSHRYRRTLGAAGDDQLALEAEELAVAYGEKARDSFLYLHLMDECPGKPRRFIVLVALEGNARNFEIATRNTKRYCVLKGPFQRHWTKPYLEDVQVLNLQAWRVLYGQVPLRRIPSSS